MKSLLFSLAALCTIGACAAGPSAAPQTIERTECALLGIPTETLTTWRESEFKDQKTDQGARDFASCLGHPDPFLRDQIGYEGLTVALRSGAVSESTRRDLIAQLSGNLGSQDGDGFLAPFSALGLSELVRTDRIEAFLTPAERVNFAANAANYIAGVSDYRAFSDQEGWRHGVAHGADVAMQLSLNQNVGTESLLELRAAIAQQITSRAGYAFTHNEPERLARPIIFMAMQNKIEADDWTAWFESLSDPAPLSDWGAAYQSETDLARLHNLKSFARVLYVNASLSENEALKPIADGALGLLRTLP